MAVRKVLKEGNDTLRKTSRKVDKFDDKLATLLDDMAETLKIEDGVGLAAPQVGILRRIFVIDVGDGVIDFINPEIVFEDGEQTGQEGCLSVVGRRGIVTRPMTVTVKAFNREGKPFEITMSELGARAIEHENDHLNGVLFIDKCDKMLSEEDEDEEGDAE